MKKILTQKQLNLKHKAEKSIEDFYNSYSDASKKFKLFGIEYAGNRILIHFLSTKKNDNFSEFGTKFQKVTGDINEK